MEHFVVYQNIERMESSLEVGRLRVQGRMRGQLLGALNNKLWVISNNKVRGRARYLLHGAFVAGTISEALSGDYLIDGTEGIDFDPPISLDDLAWFGATKGARSGLRNGINQIADSSLIDHLLGIEQQVRMSRSRRRYLTTGGAAETVQYPSQNQQPARHRTAGPAPRLAQRENAVVQAHAMSSAMDYYRIRWKNVDDVSSSEPYDIHCDDPKGRVLAVKVKGTTAGWENLLLTAAEEHHAREAYPDIALYVLYEVGIATTTDGELVARGGTTRVIDPWDIGLDELSPLIYGCRISRHRAHGSR